MHSKRIKLTSTPPDFQFACTHINNSIFITGGFKFDYRRKTLECNPKSGALIPRRDMNYGRYAHGMLGIRDRYKDTYLYVIGGQEGSMKYLNKCEKFNISINQWSPLPEINRCKSKMAACVFEENIIYIFGGEYEEEALYDIEKLDIKEEGFGWRLITITHNEGWEGRLGSGAFQIDDRYIMLFGGHSNIECTHYFYFNTTTNTLSIRGELPQYDDFIPEADSHILYDGRVWIFGGLGLADLYNYNVRDALWTKVDRKSWDMDFEFMKEDTAQDVFETKYFPYYMEIAKKKFAEMALGQNRHIIARPPYE